MDTPHGTDGTDDVVAFADLRRGMRVVVGTSAHFPGRIGTVTSTSRASVTVEFRADRVGIYGPDNVFHRI